tara:strand:+ start:335 stop:460 length:126 start_codon:yes stop_codon:yes gene_type:complete
MARPRRQYKSGSGDKIKTASGKRVRLGTPKSKDKFKKKKRK